MFRASSLVVLLEPTMSRPDPDRTPLLNTGPCSLIRVDAEGSVYREGYSQSKSGNLGLLLRLRSLFGAEGTERATLKSNQREGLISRDPRYGSEKSGSDKNRSDPATHIGPEVRPALHNVKPRPANSNCEI